MEGQPPGESWIENLNFLKEYIQQYKSLPKRKEHYCGRNLGTWCNKQRNKKKWGKLSSHEIEQLQEIPGWAWGKTHELAWIENLNLLKEYVQKYESLPKQKEKYAGRNIGMWCKTQKNKKKLGKLCQDRIQKLEQLSGWVWYTN